jgi:N-acetylmuramoyl-L-alanine amidase
MPWNKSAKLHAACGAALLLFCALIVSVADRDRQLTVYTPQKTYSVRVQERPGLYINLVDLLEPLGTAAVQAGKKNWKLHFNRVDGIFVDGSDVAMLRGRTVDLHGKVLVENNRVLVPLGASFTILSALLMAPVELHPNGRRLFIDHAETRFTAELKKGDKSSLLLNFDHVVQPAIVQEENKVRLTFKSEPVVSDIVNQPWDDKTIHSLGFSEENGEASLTITGAAGLNAALSSDGRSITIQLISVTAPAAVAPASVTAPEASPPAAVAQKPQPTAESETHAAPAFFVMIDPGHGGDDRGALLGEKLVEKDVTLAMGRRLKAELLQRGVGARLLRDGDTTLSLDQRAEITNEWHTAIYVALHAGTPGSGVRVYYAAPVSGTAASGKFLPWDDAQAIHLSRSQSLARGIAGALGKRNLKASSLSTPLRPLNNINALAIAVELAADRENVQDVTGQKFQTSVAAGIASVVAQERSQWERQP